jgi:hypothetical protein
MGKLQELIEEVRKLTKEIRRERREDQQDVEQEAKRLLAHYIEAARAQFDQKYDEPEDAPRELDDEDARDKKIRAMMTKMVNTILDPLTAEEESSEEDAEMEDGSEEEEEGEGDDEEESEEEAEVPEVAPKQQLIRNYNSGINY